MSTLRIHGMALVDPLPVLFETWSRAVDGAELIQHSSWLFDTEENARAAKATFNTLRDMPDAPAEWVGWDVCQVIGET